MLMRKRKSGPENLFVSTSEEILIALLDGDLSCGKHLSRLLPRLEDHQLIYSKYPKMQRINRLMPKGRLVALLALEKKRALEKIQVSEEQVQELKVWAGEEACMHDIVVGVEWLPIFQQSVDACLYEGLLNEQKRRKARSVQDVIRQVLREAKVEAERHG
jgi:hypothetical protein